VHVSPENARRSDFKNQRKTKTEVERNREFADLRQVKSISLPKHHLRHSLTVCHQVVFVHFVYLTRCLFAYFSGHLRSFHFAVVVVVGKRR
jgi:hypothetical protein